MKEYLVAFLLIITPFGYAQTKDSTTIVSLFDSALKNPDKVDSVLKEVNGLTKSHLLKDTYLYNYAKFLFQTAQLDSAIVIANKGLTLNKINSEEQYKAFKFHNILGSVYVYKNKHEQAVKEFQKTIEILERFKNYHQSALIKNNLANVFFSLNDYESSYKYSKEAYTTLKAENDSVYLPSITGVFATSAIAVGKETEAEKLGNESLELSIKYNNPLGLIVSNYCLGEVYYHQYKFEKSLTYYLESLKISSKYNHQHFVTLNKVGLLNTYNSLKQFHKALIYGLEALAESKVQKNENTLYNIHKNLGYAYHGIGDSKNGYIHINTAHNIYKDMANLDNKKAINDILVKYDTEKKERELTEIKLKEAQQNIELNNRKLWIIALVFLLGLIIILIFSYYKVHQQKLLQLQKEQEQKRVLALLEGEERERERLSNEIHDGMASSISAIKIQLEHLNTKNGKPELSDLTSQLSDLHEEARRISHNLMPISLHEHGLIQAISNYCIENSSSQTKITFLNTIQQRISIDSQTSTILYRIIQELVNNVKKHAKSNICFVQTSIQNSELSISIEDEGIGFDYSKSANSQGLKSIKKRLKNLNGEFIIDSKIGQGTLMIIHLNLSA